MKLNLPVQPPMGPMLAKALGELPLEPGMIYEPKWDGFRCIVFRDGDAIELTSRGERPLTRYFPELVEAFRVNLPQRCVVDGEIVIVGTKGLDFDSLLQRIHPAAPGQPSRIQKEAGLIFEPVVTESYRQGNSEEVERIADLVAELLTRDVTERVSDTQTVTRKMELKDILIVAPYNLQVRLLQKRLGPEARVGTIDKFQGQEAPVSIVSMTDSEPDMPTQIKKFLFSRERMNVAISRAKVLAIVVGNPALTHTSASHIDDMALINFYCRIVREGTQAPSSQT